MSDRPRVLVTAAPPTPNGSLHLGHLSGPYSGADILARAERIVGHEARLVVSLDDHQSYVPTKALEENRPPDAVAEAYSREIELLFHQAQFVTGEMLHPRSSELHQTLTRDFFTQLLAQEHLEPRTEPAPYCPNCERYLFEAYIAGDCPHCGEDSDGNSCESCARPNDCVDLREQRCNLCGTTPELRDVRRLVFPLSKWQDRLADHVDSVCMSPQLRSLAEQMLADGLPDIPVTHPTDWGLPGPLPGFANQKLYVWAEMVPGYIAATTAMAHSDENETSWADVWRDPEVTIVQFFGFDNAYFHLFLHAALLLAWDERANLPAAYVTNEFYELEGAKFSTSRRHAIWASEILATVPADIVRFVLAYDRPETSPTNFDVDRFATLVDGELVGHWNTWLEDLLTRLVARSTRISLSGLDTVWAQRYLDNLERLSLLCLEAYGPYDFSSQRACRLMCAIVQEGERLAGAYTRHYADESQSASAAAALQLEMLTAVRLAQLAAPVMPHFASRLWDALALGGEIRWIPLGALREGEVPKMPREPFFTSAADQIRLLMPDAPSTRSTA